LLLGYAPDDWNGELLERIIHPDDRERVRKEIAAAEESGTPLQTEYRVLARGGSVVWLREQARTISKRDGRPAFGESFLMDIGERKRIEDECDGLVAAERTAIAATAERQARLDLLREIAELASSLDYKASIQRIGELIVRRWRGPRRAASAGAPRSRSPMPPSSRSSPAATRGSSPSSARRPTASRLHSSRV